MSILLGAALKGIAAGGASYARQTREEEEAARREAERQRRHQMELDEIQFRRNLLTGSMGGGGGGARGGGVLDLSSGQGEELMAGKMGMSVPEYRKFAEAERTGNYDGYATKGTVYDDEYGEQQFSALPESFQQWKEEKRRQRAEFMEQYMLRDDINKIEDARATKKKSEMLGKAAEGDPNATRGILLDKGKTPEEIGSRIEKNMADARESDADADKSRRTDPNARRTGGGGGSGRSGSLKSQSEEKLTSQLSQYRMLLKQEEDKGVRGDKARIERYQKSIDEIDEELSIRRASKKGAPSGPSASTASPAPAKPAAPASGASRLPPEALSKLKEGMKTTFRNGEVWTLKNGKPEQIL